MTSKRETPIQISKTDFRKMGYQLIDSISEFIDTIDQKPVTTGESSTQLQKLIGSLPLPENGNLYHKKSIYLVRP